MSNAAARWREQLAAWAIPEHIRAAVTESPWLPPVEAMARRVDERIAEPVGPSLARTVEALDPPGSVLDVGAGTGAASLPVAARITELTAVDESAEMLAALGARAEPLGLPVHAVRGRWPEIAPDVSTVDVVVCHHVLYNVPDLGPFVEALAGHARRRVVVELTGRHPLYVLNPYWRILHDLERPDGPTADDALAVLAEMGLRPRVERWSRPQTRAAAGPVGLETTRRSLCLPPERAAELEAVLRDHPLPCTRDIVTLTLDPQR